MLDQGINSHFETSAKLALYNIRVECMMFLTYKVLITLMWTGLRPQFYPIFLIYIVEIRFNFKQKIKNFYLSQ